MKTDYELMQDIVDELRWDGCVAPTEIDVSVRQGIATLKGRAHHFMEKSAAEEATRRVAGVRSVENEIQVGLSDFSHKKSDREVTETARSALRWNCQVPRGVTVTVNNSVIILSGKTQWIFEKEAAENAIRSVLCNYEIQNNIEVKSRNEAA